MRDECHRGIAAGNHNSMKPSSPNAFLFLPLHLLLSSRMRMSRLIQRPSSPPSRQWKKTPRHVFCPPSHARIPEMVRENGSCSRLVVGVGSRMNEEQRGEWERHRHGSGREWREERSHAVNRPYRPPRLPAQHR